MKSLIGATMNQAFAGLFIPRNGNGVSDNSQGDAVALCHPVDFMEGSLVTPCCVRLSFTAVSLTIRRDSAVCWRGC